MLCKIMKRLAFMKQHSIILNEVVASEKGYPLRGSCYPWKYLCLCVSYNIKTKTVFFVRQ